MKKLLAMSLMLGVSCAFASDDMYLYWMLDEPTLGESAGSGEATVKIAQFNGTEWSKGGESGYLTMYYDTGSGKSASGGTELAFSDISDASPVYAFMGSSGADAYTYFVEIYNDSGIYHSDGMSYSSLSAYISTIKSGMATPSDPMGVTAFTYGAVPEPTSGLLLLLGVAGLALRRKNKKA